MENSKNIYLGLGSNLEFENLDSVQILQAAIDEISQKYKVSKISSFYKSPAWPVGSDAPDYVNCVIEIENNNIDPFDLMQNLLEIEKKYGRVRDKENQWAARTLDIDIVDFGGIIIDEAKNNIHLSLPHPRMHLRDFVILPLNEIAPNWVNQITKSKISNIKAQYLQLNHQFTAKRIQTY